MILEPLRWLIGKGVLGYERLTQPEPVQREMDEQAAIDAAAECPGECIFIELMDAR